MFVELKKDEYAAARDILADATDVLLVRATYEQTGPGRIWVDRMNHPRTALVRTPEGYELVGSAPEGEDADWLRALVLDRIMPEGREKGWTFLGLGYRDESWRGFLAEMFDERHPIWDWTHYLKLQKVRVDWRERLPDGFVVRPVDAEILGQDDLTNVASLRGWAEGNFGSREAFLQRGFGSCVVAGDTIASWCLSDCVSQHRCEIGIQTDSRFRRQGLATCAVAATVEHCLAHGLTEIGWHCASANTPSLATALAVGFEKVDELPYLEVALHVPDGLLVHGNQCLVRGEYGEAADWYEKGFAALDGEEKGESRVVRDRATRGRYHYRAACAWAMAGHVDAARAHLEKAFDHGTERWTLL